MPARKIDQQQLDRYLESGMTRSQIAEMHGMSEATVSKAIAKLSLWKVGGVASLGVIHEIIQDNLDVAAGLKLLYTMVMETALQKSVEAEEWREGKEQMREWLEHCLDTGILAVNDPRAAWMEKIANETDPNLTFLKASAEARAILSDYASHMEFMLNAKSVERMRHAFVQIYRASSPEIRETIEKTLLEDEVGRATFLMADKYTPTAQIAEQILGVKHDDAKPKRGRPPKKDE